MTVDTIREALITSVYCCVAWLVEASVTRTVKVKVPATDGVPARSPAGLSVRPAGKVPALTSKV